MLMNSFLVIKKTDDFCTVKALQLQRHFLKIIWYDINSEIEIQVCMIQFDQVM